ncbi:MAG: hypothetical protein ACXACO_08150 [Promethearchaeota archaeon]|jgi:hypothetical protein
MISEIRKSFVEDFKNSRKKDVQKKESSQKDQEKQTVENKIVQRKCQKNCEKASVYALLFNCEKCQHPNYSSQIICDIELLNGNELIPKSPNISLCKYL